MVVDTINDKNDPSREMVKKDGANVEKRNEENCTEPEGGITEQTVRRSLGMRTLCRNNFGNNRMRKESGIMLE